MSRRPLLVVMALVAPSIAQAAPIPLTKGWALQSSAKIGEKGEVLSTAKAATKGWYPVTVPTTVFAGLVVNNVHPDPYFGTNLRSVPGVTYPIGKNFSNLPMAEESPFAVPWWFRKQFNLPADYKGKTIWLNFGGINYRANVWLNGKQVATQDEIAGAYRSYKLDVTEAARPGGSNVVAVEIFAPKEHDLAITFVDWNPLPPDKAMGLWREVSVSASGPVALRHPLVATALTPDNQRADLTVRVLVKNASGKPVEATVKGHLEKIEVSQVVTLAAGEEKEVAFAPAEYPQLKVANPRLWWPAQMGEPHLNDLALEVTAAGKVSDRTSARFGIRTIESALDANKKRVFSVNGKKILIRGGGWSSDLMLRYDPARVEDELRYVQDMGLNTIRLEGKLEPEHLFDEADRMGILVMAGWCCCDHWEKWQNWKPEDPGVAERSLRDQLLRMRIHPSLLAWLNGSDHHPTPEIEKLYLKVEDEVHWPNPVISSATAKVSEVTGESGVKMTGPYEYVAPAYWLADKERGGAHGFNTETSPGPAVPPVESLRRMLPKEHLWPIDDVWNYHAGGGQFSNLKVYTEALEHRYGKARSLEDYAGKSQLVAYEGIRAMFEAFSRNKYTSTGVIQWMLNNAWPGLIWHLYDYYLLPGGGYFGAKNACEPYHPMYSYDDGSIWVINSTYQPVKGLKLKAQVLDLSAKVQWSQESTVEAGPDSATRTLAVPAELAAKVGPVYFVSLALTDAAGKPAGSGFYWLSSKAETFDWAKSTWYTTPTLSYADFTALDRLPRVQVKATSKTERRGPRSITHVTLENPGEALAFFIRVKLAKGAGGDEVTPVLWQDNYVSLLPGEKRELTASYRTKDLAGAKPVVEVSGFNVGE
jgi:exo-1,4-beta-D-glucosaminidase